MAHNPGTHGWSEHFDVLSKTQLDQELRLQAMAVAVLRGLARPDKFYGAHKGQSVQISKMLKMGVHTSPISELSEMPLEKATFKFITITVDEYGRGTGYTGKSLTLSQIALDESLKKMLSINQIETMDRIAWEQGFSKIDRMLIPTGTAGSPTVTFEDGVVPTTSATRNISLFDLRAAVTDLKKANAPKFDGAHYMGVFSAGAYAALFSDTSATGTVELFKYDMPEVLVRGEVGSYFGVRIVEETNSLPNTLGTTNFEGTALILGFEPVVEALAMPENVRTQRWDFDRQNGIAWVAITGFAPLWSKVNDGFYTSIRITSD